MAKYALATPAAHFPSLLRWSLDITFATLALLVGAPAWLVIAAAIKCTSPGPVLHRQREVVGKDGRLFTMYKFRTMYVNRDDQAHRNAIEAFVRENKPFDVIVDKDGVERRVFKFVNDPRVTTVGRFLRRVGLDEVPQFINVLKGEMRIVGPRPSALHEVAHYNDLQRMRLSVPPGITGLYQVTARSSVPFDEMVRIDLDYIQRQSIWFDMKIMMLTAKVMILHRGGY